MIYPVILCGGSGTRLWPLSRKSYPKQFSKLLGEHSLFQLTAQRLQGEGFAKSTIITGSDFRFIATQQLAEIEQQPNSILIEPDGRNTAPAILAAALHIKEIDPTALVLVAPSDHVIRDVTAFQDTVARGKQSALAGQIVTFGIKPNRPETGYGYLEMSEQSETAPVALKRFVEKPDEETAEQMYQAGNFLWNGGIFLFSVETILKAYEQHSPDLMSPVEEAVSKAEKDLNFLRLDENAWQRAEDISIDYAIMEKAKNLTVVPFSQVWSDLGEWKAVWREQGTDAKGVATHGPVTAIDCQDTLLRSEDPDLELVGLGLDNIIAVAMPDAVLVADASRAQDVRSAVTALKSNAKEQATKFPKDHRPWGWFESLAVGPRFQVKRILVNPGASLSLQSHHHRSEHWIVVQGTAKVTVDDTVKIVTENESIYIPLGAVHRMENPGIVPMILIEVQTGSYLGEDDIIRYEDMYQRT